MKLLKSHSLGNDYLVIESGEPLDAGLVRALCDRHLGVGGDGVLEPLPSNRADFGLRIWNPDGSQAEKSGNGLRIFARWLVDHRGAAAEHTIEVPSGVVRCRVAPEAVTVEMGQATFCPAAIPATETLIDAPREVEGTLLRLTAVGLGNPHCVVFVRDELDALPWRTWGAALEAARWFPHRTNVQIARILTRKRIAARIWERGAGETRASGSSACAVAAAAVRLGRADGQVAVEMPGGSLSVEVGPGFGLTLWGPVQEVCRVEVSSSWVEAHREAPRPSSKAAARAE